VSNDSRLSTQLRRTSSAKMLKRAGDIICLQQLIQNPDRECLHGLRSLVLYLSSKIPRNSQIIDVAQSLYEQSPVLSE
jgi:hypothetical protein